MAVQAGRGIESMLRHRPELEGDVFEARRFQAVRDETQGILRIERLGHVESVQPHLLRIDLLVPETAFRGAGLALDLMVKRIHRHTVLLFPGQFIEAEKGPARTDMVRRIIRNFVFVDPAGRVDDRIIPGVDVIQERFFASLGMTGCVPVIDVEEGLEFQAGSIVPFEFSFLAVDPGGFGIPRDFAPDKPDGEGLLPCTGSQKGGDSRYDPSLFHRLSYGFQTMPSCFWYITFSKVYSAACRSVSCRDHFTRSFFEAAPGP